MFAFRKKYRRSIDLLKSKLNEHRRVAIVLFIATLIAAGASAFLPYLLGGLIDSITVPKEVSITENITMPLWSIFIFLFAFASILNHTLHYFIDTEGDKLMDRVYDEYIVRGFEKLLRFPISFHKKHKGGEPLNRLYRAAGSINNMLHQFVTVLGAQFLSVVIAFILLFILSPLLASIVLGGVILYSIFILIRSGESSPIQKKMHKYYVEAYGNLHDGMTNVRSIKLATAEEYESKRTRKGFAKARNESLKIHRFWGGMRYSQNLMIVLIQLAVLSLSILFISQGTMTLGTLIAINGYVGLVFMPFVSIARLWENIQRGIVEVEETEKMLAEPEEIYIPFGSHRIERKGEFRGAHIVFENINFSYDRKTKVLEDVNLEILPGEVIALVGESGVGKSTLTELLAGFYFAQKGKLTINGIDIRNINLKSWRRRLALVPQEPNLFNDRIDRNISYGIKNVTPERLREAARKAHAIEFIERFPRRWKQIVGERGYKLSVGQKQRVAIARAFLEDPDVLILDEPTSALDAETEAIIKSSIEGLMAGRTTIIIAHRLSTVRKADKIIVLKRGRIIELGNHHQLMEKNDGEYRRLYELQIGLTV